MNEHFVYFIFIIGTILYIKCILSVIISLDISTNVQSDLEVICVYMYLSVITCTT
jgi:hypothetical protein